MYTSSIPHQQYFTEKVVYDNQKIVIPEEEFQKPAKDLIKNALKSSKSKEYFAELFKQLSERNLELQKACFPWEAFRFNNSNRYEIIQLFLSNGYKATFWNITICNPILMRLGND